MALAVHQVLAGAAVQEVERGRGVVGRKQRRQEGIARLLRALLVGGLDVDVAGLLRVHVQTLTHAARDAANLELASLTDGTGVVRLLLQQVLCPLNHHIILQRTIVPFLIR